MVSSVKLGSRGRVYIPEEIREMLALKEKDYIVFRRAKDGTLYIEKLV